jgi:hypothetical protein
MGLTATTSAYADARHCAPIETCAGRSCGGTPTGANLFACYPQQLRHDFFQRRADLDHALFSKGCALIYCKRSAGERIRLNFLNLPHRCLNTAVSSSGQAQ